jgi:hypothetical protein
MPKRNLPTRARINFSVLHFSGLDKNETSRRSKAGSLKNDLPYAQALLDLNEIRARHMASAGSRRIPRWQR